MLEAQGISTLNTFIHAISYPTKSCKSCLPDTSLPKPPITNPSVLKSRPSRRAAFIGKGSNKTTPPLFWWRPSVNETPPLVPILLLIPVPIGFWEEGLYKKFMRSSVTIGLWGKSLFLVRFDGRSSRFWFFLCMEVGGFSVKWVFVWFAFWWSCEGFSACRVSSVCISSTIGFQSRTLALMNQLDTWFKDAYM